MKNLTILITLLIMVGSSYAQNIGTLTDIDKNIYKTVKIGDQWWMTENLRVTKYRNGETIDSVWVYSNNESNAPVYGRLYNWHMVNDTRNIAPKGWHVPTDEEWKELEIILGMSGEEANGIRVRGTNEGGKLKSKGTSIWKNPNTRATNSSGLSVLPGGCRYFGGSFDSKGNSAYFWSSTEFNSDKAWYRHLEYKTSAVNRNNSGKKNMFSVRCVRDK